MCSALLDHLVVQADALVQRTTALSLGYCYSIMCFCVGRGREARMDPFSPFRWGGGFITRNKLPGHLRVRGESERPPLGIFGPQKALKNNFEAFFSGLKILT